MRRMSWIRSSKGIALVVLVTVSLAAVGGAMALSVSADGVPEETQVGQSSNATITLEDPFVDTDQWTLEGATELRNVSWQVTVLQQGDTVSEETYGSQEFSQNLDGANGGDTIVIRVQGDTPPVDDYTFDPEETYTLFDLDQTVGSNTNDLNASSVHHYTNESKSARNAIIDARETINETNAGSEAQSLLNRSISAYDNGNFPNAESLASDATSEAEQAEQSSQQTQLLIYGVVGLIVVALVGGGIYYWRSQQDEYGKLQ
jgi:flagellar basal body-associated protein FliL